MIICSCHSSEPMIITEEQTNKGKTKKRTREVEICVNCYNRTDKPSTKWKVEKL